MGCCCGHPDRGGPKTAPGMLKRLAFTDCLGPCSEANVIFLYVQGRPLWLRRINTADTFGALLEYATEAVEGGPVALPAALGRHAFTWTGGGSGPTPPVAD